MNPVVKLTPEAYLAFERPHPDARHEYLHGEITMMAGANPFAIVVMAHLHTQATRRMPQQRLHAKMQLIRHLYSRGYGRQDVLDLFRLLDWLLVLPTDLAQQFQDDVQQLERETQMRYVTSIERLSREAGIKEGERQLLRRMLTRRFGPLPVWAEQRLAQASTQELEEWSEAIFEAPGLEALLGKP